MSEDDWEPTARYTTFDYVVKKKRLVKKTYLKKPVEEEVEEFETWIVRIWKHKETGETKKVKVKKLSAR